VGKGLRNGREKEGQRKRGGEGRGGEGRGGEVERQGELGKVRRGRKEREGKSGSPPDLRPCTPCKKSCWRPCLLEMDIEIFFLLTSLQKFGRGWGKTGKFGI
jgi:hypothetical protein